jgi:hypothetical protein
MLEKSYVAVAIIHSDIPIFVRILQLETDTFDHEFCLFFRPYKHTSHNKLAHTVNVMLPLIIYHSIANQPPLLKRQIKTAHTQIFRYDNFLPWVW